MFAVLLLTSIHDSIDMSTRWIDCDRALRYKESEPIYGCTVFGSRREWINRRLQRVTRKIFTPSETRAVLRNLNDVAPSANWHPLTVTLGGYNRAVVGASCCQIKGGAAHENKYNPN